MTFSRSGGIYSRVMAGMEWLTQMYKPLFSLYMLVFIPAGVIAYLFQIPEQRIFWFIFIAIVAGFILYSSFYLLPIRFLNRRARHRSLHPDVFVYIDRQTIKFRADDKVLLTRQLSVSAAAEGVQFFDKKMLWNGRVDDIEIIETSNCRLEMVSVDDDAGIVVRYIFEEDLPRGARTEISYSMLIDNNSGLIRKFIGSATGSYKAELELFLEIFVEDAPVLIFTEKEFYNLSSGEAQKKNKIYKRDGHHCWKIDRPRHSRKYILSWDAAQDII